MTKKEKWTITAMILISLLIWLYVGCLLVYNLYPRTEDDSGDKEVPALLLNNDKGEIKMIPGRQGDSLGGVGGAVKLVPSLSYDEVEMEVTGYCPCEICCGIFADWVTASGRPAEGFLLAAPPKYPFRTFMAVEGYAEGKYVPVLDRGVAITGNRLDILFPDHNSAKDWGRQTIKVKVLKERIEQ